MGLMNAEKAKQYVEVRECLTTIVEAGTKYVETVTPQLLVMINLGAGELVEGILKGIQGSPETTAALRIILNLLPANPDDVTTETVDYMEREIMRGIR